MGQTGKHRLLKEASARQLLLPAYTRRNPLYGHRLNVIIVICYVPPKRGIGNLSDSHSPLLSLAQAVPRTIAELFSIHNFDSFSLKQQWIYSSRRQKWRWNIGYAKNDLIVVKLWGAQHWTETEKEMRWAMAARLTRYQLIIKSFYEIQLALFMFE